MQKIPWHNCDIFHDDPENYPLEDYLPVDRTWAATGSQELSQDDA